jgi:signal transduction histidine kinase
MGIKKENMDKLFTDFQKLNEHKSINTKGTGLGLSVCKQIIELMGGKVSVSSIFGVGTKINILL